MSPGSPTQVAGTQVLEPSFVALKGVHQQEAGSEAEMGLNALCYAMQTSQVMV